MNSSPIIQTGDPMLAAAAVAAMQQDQVQMEAKIISQQLFIACYAQTFAFEVRLGYEQAQRAADAVGQEVENVQINFGRAVVMARDATKAALQSLGFKIVEKTK